MDLICGGTDGSISSIPLIEHSLTSRGVGETDKSITEDSNAKAACPSSTC